MRNINTQNQVSAQAVEQMKKNPIALVIEQTLWKVNETLDKKNIYWEVLQNAQDLLAHAKLEQELAWLLNTRLKEAKHALPDRVEDMFRAPEWKVVELAWVRKIDTWAPNKTVELAWLKRAA